MAEAQIGMQKVQLPCMAIEGCDEQFTESQVRRFLRPETMELWSRLRAQEDVSAANIEGLEHCPFCENMMIFDESVSKTEPFACRNPACLKSSCRRCKQPWHKDLACDESQERTSLNGRQKAEEELSETLIRRCPKCCVAILKDESAQSCNKMSCSKCKLLICYICRKDITKTGYAHFDDGAPQSSSKATGKCPLYDDTAARHMNEVATVRSKLGDQAPPLTDIDRKDAKKRRKRFDARFGPDAQQDIANPVRYDPNRVIEEERLLDQQFALVHQAEEEAALRAARLQAIEAGDVQRRALGFQPAPAVDQRGGAGLRIAPPMQLAGLPQVSADPVPRVRPAQRHL